jgi:putative solute:sodium symporter small subunit
MEPQDNYDFSIFQPRNLHGRKNRNVILTMLLIWAVAVFGFQFLLRAIEKPVPEKALSQFESVWPAAMQGNLSEADQKSLLHSLLMVMGKNVVSLADQAIVSAAVGTTAFMLVPDSIKSELLNGISSLSALKIRLASAKDLEYLEAKAGINLIKSDLSEAFEPYTGFAVGSLEAGLLTGSLNTEFPASLSDASLQRLPEIMKLYLTHNQSVLTDTVFLGFPFHYFYTAIFLLVLFVALCIVYNLLVERRLEKQGVVEQ